MPPGKLAAQAAHAAAQSLIACLTQNPHWTPWLRQLPHSGTRVVLQAPNADALHDVHARAQHLGLPSALFEDSGHLLPPHFTGQRILTALGLGPAPRALLRPLVRRFSCA